MFIKNQFFKGDYLLEMHSDQKKNKKKKERERENEREKDRKEETFHLSLQSPNACNSQVWARLMPAGRQHSISVILCVVVNQASGS